MATLVLIAAVCFAVLLLAAVAVWWSIRRTPAVDEERSFVPLLPAGRSRAGFRNAGKPHPRLDLAAGIVASAHNVRVATSRRMLAMEDAAETLMPKRNNRPDWAYYNENMGDLSDPDLNRPFRRPIGSVAVPESR